MREVVFVFFLICFLAVTGFGFIELFKELATVRPTIQYILEQ